jgi:hypothetical protein
MNSGDLWTNSALLPDGIRAPQAAPDLRKRILLSVAELPPDVRFGTYAKNNNPVSPQRRRSGEAEVGIRASPSK